MIRAFQSDPAAVFLVTEQTKLCKLGFALQKPHARALILLRAVDDLPLLRRQTDARRAGNRIPALIQGKARRRKT